jgi:DNA repair protein RecO (recombination protein O)
VKKVDYAILVNRINFSESSLVLTFFTRENGIQKFIFQGGKKKSGPLFPLSVVEITYFKRPDSELGKITNVEAKHLLTEIRSEVLKSTIAFFVTDVLRKSLHTEEMDLVLFAFLESEIQFINQNSKLANYPIWFLIQFSKHIGFFPYVTSENPQFLNIFDGQLSNTKPKEDVYYQGDSIKLITDLIHSDRETAMQLNFPKAHRSEALKVLLSYYKYHVPHFNNLTSVEVINELLYS